MPVPTVSAVSLVSETLDVVADLDEVANSRGAMAGDPWDPENGLSYTTVYPWYDTSGKGDDGDNSSGGASFSSAGGGSFTFNGSSNYVSSDDKANLQLGSGNFTLAAWIKPGSPQSNNQGIISYSDSSGEELSNSIIYLYPDPGET